ncbi:hypothetical protein NDA10_002187 [Ustilago hordei]|nr:hypothetical protein NDA10_002187 [Ustilago hordei]
MDTPTPQPPCPIATPPLEGPFTTHQPIMAAPLAGRPATTSGPPAMATQPITAPTPLTAPAPIMATPPLMVPWPITAPRLIMPPVMGLDAQEAGGSLVCSRSRRVTGSYGWSTGIEDLVDTSREHGRSAVSMETMDSYGFTCKGALSPYARRTRHSHEEDQAQKSRRSHEEDQAQMVTTQGLERQEVDTGHEEEEQCRRSRHRS